MTANNHVNCQVWIVVVVTSWPLWPVDRHSLNDLKARGVGAGGHRGTCPQPPTPKKIRKKRFSINHHAKLRHFRANIMWNSGILLIFHSYIFGQKCLAPKLTAWNHRDISSVAIFSRWVKFRVSPNTIVCAAYSRWQKTLSRWPPAKFFFAGAICTYRESRPFIGPLFIERDPVIEETIALSNQFRNAFHAVTASYIIIIYFQNKWYE